MSVSEEKRGVSIELLLYGLVLVGALAVRVYALGRWPLQDEEAGLALAAWRFGQGVPATLRWHSPLLFHANGLLFFLTGGSDNLARLWCVLFGSLLTLWPYGLRRYLGKGGALTAALVLAFSPGLTYSSRAVSGDIIVVFCALGLLVTVVRYVEERRTVWVLAAAGLSVLALLAGPSFYSVVVILGISGLFLYVRSRSGRDAGRVAELREAWADVLEDERARRGALSIAAVLFLGVGTAFTLNPAGLQMTLDQFGLWLGGFGSGAAPWYRGLLVLALYEALPLFLGVVGLYLMRRSRGLFHTLVRCWFVVAMALCVVRGARAPQSALLVMVPLVLSAGRAAEHLWQATKETAKVPLFWVLVVLSLCIGAAVYTQLALYLLSPVQVYLLRMGALCLFVASAHALLGSMGDWKVALCAAGTALVVLLGFGMVRAGVRVNYVRAREPTEPLVGRTTSPDVLELAAYATTLSSRTDGDPRTLSWLVDETLKVPLGWYMRDFEQVSYVPNVQNAPDVGGLIAPVGAAAPERFVGLRFRVHSEPSGTEYPAVDWMRWWTGHKSNIESSVSGEDVMLWIMSAQ